MKILIAMDQKNGSHLIGEIAIRDYYRALGELQSDITTKDLNGVTTGDIDTWLGTLTDDHYTKVHVMVNANVTAATGVLSKLQMGVMLEKILLTEVAKLTADAEGTCDTNSTSTVIKLAATQAEADDFFNDMFVITAGITAWTALITDWVLSTKLITVADSTVAITTTETYAIYSAATLEGVMPVYAETYEAHEVFTLLYPNLTNVPLLIGEMNGMPGDPCLTATANSVATASGVSTLTDTGNFVAGAYDDGTWYVGIRSCTTGAGQVLRIISNTADVLTLDGNWDPLPVTSIVYEVVDNKRLALCTYFLQFAARALVADPSDLNKLDFVMNMISKGAVIDSDDTLLFQDLEALEEFKAKGQTIMRAIGMGITS